MNKVGFNPLSQLVNKLSLHGPLTAEDRVALFGLPYSSRLFEAGSYLLREGEISSNITLLVSGMGFRQKCNAAGFRQILSICIPGEIINLQQAYIGIADNNVQVLTQCETALISHVALRQLVDENPSIARAFFVASLVDLSMSREWMLNIGRRNARARVAHFLCEIALRLNSDGVPNGQTYELPMTQEQLGDALGLTAVHINRTLKGLVRDGLICRSNYLFTIPDWELLVHEAGFNTRHLHLNR